MARSLAPMLDGYDVVILDCPPSLGLLTVNGLTAAAEVLIPLQPETLSHRAVGQLLETVEEVRTFTNPGSDRAGGGGDHVRRPHQIGPPDPRAGW